MSTNLNIRNNINILIKQGKYLIELIKSSCYNIEYAEEKSLSILIIHKLRSVCQRGTLYA